MTGENGLHVEQYNNWRTLGGVYVSCVYSHAKLWSLCIPCLLTCQVELPCRHFGSLLLCPSSLECCYFPLFIWQLHRVVNLTVTPCRSSRKFVLSMQEDELFNCLRPPPPYPGGSDSEAPSPARSRRVSEKQSALSAIQPLLAAHGLGESTIAAVAASVSGSAGSKSKKIKLEKDKDPNAPKKPANAFLMFCQQRRPIIQEEYLKVHAHHIAVVEPCDFLIIIKGVWTTFNLRWWG